MIKENLPSLGCGILFVADYCFVLVFFLIKTFTYSFGFSHSITVNFNSKFGSKRQTGFLLYSLSSNVLLNTTILLFRLSFRES